MKRPAQMLAFFIHLAETFFSADSREPALSLSKGRLSPHKPLRNYSRVAPNCW